MHDEFSIERRSLLFLAPLAAAGLFARSTNAATPTPGTLAWDDFIEAALSDARSVYDANGYDEDYYLCRLASDAIRLRSIPDEAKTFRFGKLDPPVEFGPAFRGSPFFVIQWKLAPNAWLPPHNHPHYNVLTVGVEGEAVITHYEIEGEAPPFDSAAGFSVRRTRETLIAPRRLSPLTSTRDNIHTFRAGPKGARGVDITSRAGADMGFSFLDINEKASDAARNVFGAKWRKLT